MKLVYTKNRLAIYISIRKTLKKTLHFTTKTYLNKFETLILFWEHYYYLKTCCKTYWLYWFWLQNIISLMSCSITFGTDYKTMSSNVCKNKHIHVWVNSLYVKEDNVSPWSRLAIWIPLQKCLQTKIYEKIIKKLWHKNVPGLRLIDNIYIWQKYTEAILDHKTIIYKPNGEKNITERYHYLQKSGPRCEHLGSITTFVLL